MLENSPPIVHTKKAEAREHAKRPCLTRNIPDPKINILVGDSREKLLELPDQYFRACVTSPPYWGLRDYDTENQIGAEMVGICGLIIFGTSQTASRNPSKTGQRAAMNTYSYLPSQNAIIMTTKQSKSKLLMDQSEIAVLFGRSTPHPSPGRILPFSPRLWWSLALQREAVLMTGY